VKHLKQIGRVYYTIEHNTHFEERSYAVYTAEAALRGVRGARTKGRINVAFCGADGTYDYTLGL
jgi:hypothetical protein